MNEAVLTEFFFLIPSLSLAIFQIKCYFLRLWRELVVWILEACAGLVSVKYVFNNIS